MFIYIAKPDPISASPFIVGWWSRYVYLACKEKLIFEETVTFKPLISKISSKGLPKKAPAWKSQKSCSKSKILKTNVYSIIFGGDVGLKNSPNFRDSKTGTFGTPDSETRKNFFFFQICWWFSKITSGMILGLNLSSRNCEFRKPVSFFPNSDLPLFDPSFPQTFDQNWNRIRFCGVLRLCKRPKVQSKKYASINYNLWQISNARQVTIYIRNQT